VVSLEVSGLSEGEKSAGALRTLIVFNLRYEQEIQA
jgi:hypothetical protein